MRFAITIYLYRVSQKFMKKKKNLIRTKSSLAIEKYICDISNRLFLYIYLKHLGEITI